MGESAIHSELVRAIVRWVSTKTELSKRGALLSCLPESSRHDTPPTLSGSVPDVFIKDDTSGTVLIGEAKTSWDIETRRTRAQLTAYLKYLMSCRDAILVIAVPWYCSNQMRSLIRYLQQRTGAHSVNVYVLEELAG